MLWQQIQEKIERRITPVDAASPNPLSDRTQRPVIYVDTDQQLLFCVYAQSTLNQNYPISTSRHGLGQQQGSFQTPVGLHRIAEKIGDGEPVGRVFKGRKPTSEQCLPNQNTSEEDIISTRILWLEGLEPCVNKGGECDSRDRYIYIHGTSDEAHIGQPASIGCIRMNNEQVIDLFNRVEEGDLVLVE